MNLNLTTMKEEMNEKKEWVTPEIVDLDMGKTASGTHPTNFEETPVFQQS